MRVTIEVSKKEIMERFREDIEKMGFKILTENIQYIGDYEDTEFDGIRFDVEK